MYSYMPQVNRSTAIYRPQSAPPGSAGYQQQIGANYTGPKQPQSQSAGYQYGKGTPFLNAGRQQGMPAANYTGQKLPQSQSPGYQYAKQTPFLNTASPQPTQQAKMPSSPQPMAQTQSPLLTALGQSSGYVNPNTASLNPVIQSSMNESGVTLDQNGIYRNTSGHVMQMNGQNQWVQAPSQGGTGVFGYTGPHPYIPQTVQQNQANSDAYEMSRNVANAPVSGAYNNAMSYDSAQGMNPGGGIVNDVVGGYDPSWGKRGMQDSWTWKPGDVRNPASIGSVVASPGGYNSPEQRGSEAVKRQLRMVGQ